MSFGLTNALTAFMNLMHRVFQPYLHQFVVVFVDDILIYFKSEEDHEDYLRIVLQALNNIGCTPSSISASFGLLR